MRDSQYRMIINLTTADEAKASGLRKHITAFVKQYDVSANKLDAKGLAAREKFFADCDKLAEIYQPHFDKFRRQQKRSRKGKKYLESLNNRREAENAQCKN